MNNAIVRPLNLLLCTGLFAACTQDYGVSIRSETDTFVQSPPSSVDILFVVDNSGSMGDFQEHVGSLFSEFLSFPLAGNLDLQLAAVTTTVTEAQLAPEMGCTQEVIDALQEPGTLDRGIILTDQTATEENFADMLNLGTCGAPDEWGLEAARLALSEPLVSTTNAGFLRDEASLSIIVLSDDDDDSPYSVYDYVNFFATLKDGDLREAFNISSFIIVEYESCLNWVETFGFDSQPGYRYMYVSETSDGVIGDLCDEDYEDTMTDLSLAIARLKDSFTLSELPAPATLEVKVDDTVIPCTSGRWWYELQEGDDGEEVGVIVFDRTEIPLSESTLTVRYNLGGGNPDDFCAGDAE